MPPLRNRGHDLFALVEHFIRLISGTTPVSAGQPDHRITPTAMRQLQRYDWPGNLTELRSVIAAELRLGSGGIVDNERLSKLCAQADPSPTVRGNSGAAASTTPDATPTIRSANAGHRPPSETSADSTTFSIPEPPQTQSKQPDGDPLRAMRHPAAWSPIVERMLRRESPDDEVPSLHSDAVVAMEYGLVASVLEKTDGNLAQSARLLGITRVSLRRKIQALGLKIPGRNFD
jgi:two-component system nitrogen regulation response regulator GlnG